MAPGRRADLRSKLDACRRRLGELKRVVVAFSGGTDSTLVLALAADVLGAQNVLAVTAVSPSLGERERRAAHQMADKIGVELIEVETNELDNPHYAANPPDRCFHCKSELFGRLKALAAERGFHAVLSGANADDTGDFRPGLAAGRQLGVIRPLLDARLTKQDVRSASRAMGLETWNKSPMACLASRVPYGQPLTPERLRRIERAEDALRDMGLEPCRVRDHDTVARVEVPVEMLSAAVQRRQEITQALKAVGYTYVALDLQGLRSGSMNEALEPAAKAPRRGRAPKP